MVRVLRYPRLFALSCAGSMVLALARDFCVSGGHDGWADVLLVLTLMMLGVCLALLSCRFIVDSFGVGVGFLFRMRRASWDELGALGALCCNGQRMYLYGMYKGRVDFLRMLHRAPLCGSWGFVVPVSRKLASAIAESCPFEVDLYTGMRSAPRERMHAVWQQAATQLIPSLIAALAALITGGALLLRAASQEAYLPFALITVIAAALIYIACQLLWRAFSMLMICPRFSEHGISAGRSLYLPWEEVRFGYVHRQAQMSGLFLLSAPLESLGLPGQPPVRCLSMPDYSTLVLAYLTYCPHANKAVEP